MNYSLLCILFLFFYLQINGEETKRITDQMYITFDRVRYCVRRMNSTHEIGCQSSERGNSGRMYMIDNDKEFNSYISDSKTINAARSFIIVLNADLFRTSYVDRLSDRLDSKLNGLVIYIKSNLSRPSQFSHDDQCPNNRQSFYLNQTEIINWNTYGTGLFFRSFPFPMMFIDEKDDYQRLLEFYNKFNSLSGPSCGLELKTFQNAAHSSKTCMRRNDVTHSAIDGSETFCDPVGGLNIYSRLPQTLTTVPNVRLPKSVIFILTPTDGFQMFLKASSGTTGGAQQPGTSVITFLALAHLIGQEQDEFNKQNKEIIFLTVDGDALDYSASFRFMFDMKNGYFPKGNDKEQRIQVEHIHSIIELQSLSLADSLSFFSYPSSLINQTFIDSLVQRNPMIKPMPAQSILPPASSQIFLRETLPGSFPAYILTSSNRSHLSNLYYHSFFDDPSTLSINLSLLEYNTTTNLTLFIKNIVEPLAGTLLETLTGIEKNLTISQDIINNLVYCVFKNINCPLIHNVTNQTVGKAFEQYEQTSLPFSINTYPTSTTPTFPFVEHILAYFLRDRSYDNLNLTENECIEARKNDSFRSYIYVGGYSPSITSNQTYTGYCVRTYKQSTESLSPAFVINNYDLSQTKYPAWTESRWSTISLKLFIIPTRTHEILTLITGVLLLSVSLIMMFLLKYFSKIHLLQPSAS